MHVTIAHPGPINPSGSIPLAIAQEQGFFAKYGLEVRVVGGTIGSDRMIGKEAEFGYFGTPAILRAIAQDGADLKIVAVVNEGRTSEQLVTKDSIKRPEDLRGKRFGLTSIGAGTWITIIQAFDHFGLEPTRDSITLVPVGNVTQIAKALQDGAIDAAMLTPAQSGQLTQKGFSVLLDMSASGILGAQRALAATGSYLEQHPDVVEKVITALTAGMAFSLDPNNKQALLAAIAKIFNLSEVAAAEKAYKDLSDLKRKPYPAPERLKDMQKVMALHDPKVLAVMAERAIDDRLVRKLDQSGVIDRLYLTKN